MIRRPPRSSQIRSSAASDVYKRQSDNQYCGDDIEKLVRPILDEKADIVIGERPIDNTAHFSPLKKKLQHLGSWTVRVASHSCLLYTSDAADDLLCVDLGACRIIKKKKDTHKKKKKKLIYDCLS